MTQSELIVLRNGVDIVTLDRATTPDDSLALFTCADSLGQSQFNAWGSWQHIPNASVSVFGNAPGIGEHAKRFGFRHFPTVKRNEFGRPLLNCIFERMYDESTQSVLGYVNSDIILLPGLAASVAAVRAQFDAYLMVARRWNVDRLPAIDFRPGWGEKLRDFVTLHGDLFTPYGIDLFVFSRGLLREIPPFALGSDYWDNYLVMRTRRRGYPVIDITEQVMLVHQNHPFGKYRSEDERRRGPEGLRGFALLGDSYAMLGRTTDATHVVAHGALKPTETAHVTVVLPHRGEPRRLCRWLRALEHQSYPQSFLNAIVVNNDSEAPLRYLEADFPAVRVVTESRPRWAAARNKGISCANAEVVAFFDADMALTAHCIERAMRMMKDVTDCQVVLCRIQPHFASGKTSYIGRAVEWFDAVTHYNEKDWHTYADTFVTGALIVRKEVFAQCGYFSEFGLEAASDNREWAHRVIAAGVKVAFCRQAVVRHGTVRSIAELKRKKHRHARGDCILKALESGEAYRVEDILRDEWRELRERVWNVWSNKKIPSRYRAGALLVSLWSSVWTLSARLQHRNEAQRAVRRRRKEMSQADQPHADTRTRSAGLPFRWLAARVSSRRLSNQDAPPRSPN
jgi:GT2 family glycosyltransferase